VCSERINGHVSCIGRFPSLCQCRHAVSDAGSSLSDRIYADLIMTAARHGATQRRCICFGDGRVCTVGAELTPLLSADASSCRRAEMRKSVQPLTISRVTS